MITKFFDTELISDHDRFQAWRTEHQDGAVLMLDVEGTAMLHGVRCFHFGSGPPYFSSTDGFGSLTSKSKLCGSESELIEWAAQNGVILKGCLHCTRDGLIGALDVELDPQRQTVEAETVLVRVLPERTNRELVLKRLVDSAEIAETTAPSAWGATLFSSGFRLNVGQVEVLVLAEETLRVNLLTELGVPPVVGPRFVATQYRSMPEPQCAFVGAIAEFAQVEEEIVTAHEAFVRRAASTRSGQPRAGSPFRRSHNEGLLEFARSTVARTKTGTATPARSSNVAQHRLLPEELPEGAYREGQGVQVTVNRYERDPSAREACLDHFGPVCQICQVDLSIVYGKIAEKLVHVHHLHPLSQVEGEYEVRPDRDLIPVCPNCHAVVHRKNPPLTPAEVQVLIAEARVRS